MESKNYGNFLADKFIVVNKHKYFRKTYLFFLQVFMFFLLCGVLVEGTAWGYCFYKYSLPQASQIETQYKKSRAINQKIQEAGADLRQAEEENLKVLSFLTLVAKSKPAALSLRSLNMTKDNIQILGESTDVKQVASFSDQLKTDNFGPSRIERLSEKDNKIFFTLVLTAKQKAKAATQAPEGGTTDAQ